MFFFFFKQKTAYEMRISDWSSDVCSSDLFFAIASPRRGCASVLVAQTAVKPRSCSLAPRSKTALNSAGFSKRARRGKRAASFIEEQRLRAEALAALGATTRDHRAATLGRHTGAGAVSAGTAQLLRLISALGRESPACCKYKKGD